MIRYKTDEQIEIMRQSALLVSDTLGMLAGLVAPGVSPLHLDKKAEEFIRDMGGAPGFLGLYNCPSTLLTSVNEQVCMDLPTRIRVLHILLGKALVHCIEFDAVFSAKFHGFIEFFARSVSP